MERESLQKEINLVSKYYYYYYYYLQEVIA